MNFTNTSTNGVSYFWNFGDGSTSTATSPSHTYTSSGTYNVMLISINNCTSDTIYQQVVLLLTGVEENELTKIEVFPNPVKDFVNINFSDTKTDKMVLTDLIGKELLIITNTKDNMRLDLSPYRNGVYFLRFYAGDKMVTYRINKID